MKAIEDLINHMGIQNDVINFDNAALSYLPQSVIDALHQYNLRRDSHGAEYDRYWEAVEKARNLCAKKINSNSQEIFFIQNTSMGLNFIANAIGLKAGDNVIVTDMEFPSNIYPWMNFNSNGVEVRFVKNKDGIYTPEQIEELIDENTKAVSINWVVAANGTVLNINRIGEICKKHHVYYAVDGIQGLGVIPVDVKQVQCDFFVSGFFKWMMGPDGIAFVYIRKEILNQLEFPWLGWAGMKNKFDYSQFVVDPIEEAKRYETGNMNFSALTGLVSCLEFTDGYEPLIYERVSSLVSYLRNELSKIPAVRLLSNCKTLSGITLFTIDNKEKLSALIAKLKQYNVKFSTRGGIRISIHFYNTKEEIDVLLNCIRTVSFDK